MSPGRASNYQYIDLPSLSLLSHSKMQSQCCISELKKAQQSDCCCQNNYFPSAHQVSSTFWRSPDKVEEPSICWWYALHDKGSAIKMWIKVEVKSARDKLCKVAGAGEMGRLTKTWHLPGPQSNGIDLKGESKIYIFLKFYLILNLYLPFQVLFDRFDRLASVD